MIPARAWTAMRHGKRETYPPMGWVVLFIIAVLWVALRGGV